MTKQELFGKHAKRYVNERYVYFSEDEFYSVLAEYEAERKERQRKRLHGLASINMLIPASAVEEIIINQTTLEDK